jgi:predicted GTPase
VLGAHDFLDLKKVHDSVNEVISDSAQRGEKENDVKTNVKPRECGSFLPQCTPVPNSLTVMLLGETGSGKSTFINYLANYFLGGHVNNGRQGIRVVIPTHFFPEITESIDKTTAKSNERNLGKETGMGSQTANCKTYNFKKGNTVFSFVDTPGLSDTEGSQKDEENIAKILKQAEDLDSLAAIVLIVNGTCSRLTFNMQNVLVRFKGSLPDTVLNNIFVVFTNCDSELNRNFDLAVLTKYFKPRHISHMQNLAFASNPEKWVGKALQQVKHTWENSMNEIDELLECIKKIHVVATTDFKTMRDLKFQIKNMLHESRLQIQKLQQLHDDITKFQTQAQQYGSQAQNFSNFVQTRVEKIVKMVDADYHSTICSTCNYVCHDHCGLEEVTTTGTNHFINCAAMKGENCTVCPKRCIHSVHYHSRKKMVEEEKTVEDVLEDIKAKYELSMKNKNEAEKQCTDAASALALIEAAVQKEREDVEAKCKELKKICSGFNLVDELYIHIQQLIAEAKNLTSLEARKKAEEYIESLEIFVDTLSGRSAAQTKYAQPQ